MRMAEYTITKDTNTHIILKDMAEYTSTKDTSTHIIL